MMIELTGISLSERKKELNAKINDAAKNKTNFDELKSQKEQSDVDKLYKIGVASKYKDVEYIIEILKSGDSLYISKALKCIWLYDNEYSHIINPGYLDENIFPLMSIKMIKKFLITISMYLSDTRAIDFYTYCNGIKYTNIAMKFLIFTPQSFKLEILADVNMVNKLRQSPELLTFFLGNSFDLAEAYYSTAAECDQPNTLYQLRHFYFISDVKYLEMVNRSTSHWTNFKRLGLRTSADIMKKHKDEIYKDPMRYLYMLNKSMLVRYSTVDDAKFYAKTLIVHECPYDYDFWYMKFCQKYEYILNKIPSEQRLAFIKNIFTDQYSGEGFEMCIEFYNAKLYKLMTIQEREDWALTHIHSELELLGSGRDFLWYRFVSFDKAFPAIKRYILVAVNIDVRIEIICVLIESAKNDKDLETLFDYYYKRHINEQQHYKERFVDTILSEHNVYNFGESSWNAFNKILFSLEVYNVLDPFSCKTDYKIIALIYHIIHGKDIPEALTNFIDSGIYMYTFRAQTDKLTIENVTIVYQYLLQFYLDKIKLFDDKAYDNEVKIGVRKYIQFVLDLMYQYQKSKEDIPAIVNKYIQLDFDEFRGHLLIRKEPEPELTHRRLIGFLKKNKNLVISNIPLIREKMINKFKPFKFNTLLKILRIYFSNDLATIFLKFFNDMIAEQNPPPCAIKTAIYGIFELADIGFKTDFMTKYVPEEAKIDHINVDRKSLCIQEAICKMVCYSRPPIPLADITKYIKGDYVKYCLPMFNSYLVKLPKPLCLEFVKSLLDRPLSVQKHGLRMAFECFTIEDLRKVVLDVWNNTINVSLRSIIYTYLHNKIKDVDEHDQNVLFEDLKSFTRTLGQEDDGGVFALILSDSLPGRFIGEYIEIAWNVVDKFPTRIRMFIERRQTFIDCMHRNIYLIKKDVIESIIYDLVNVMLKQQQIRIKYEKVEDEYLTQSKWNLIHKYVTFFTDEDDFQKKAELVMDVVKESLKMWDKVDENKYIVKEFVSDLLVSLSHNSYQHDFGNFAKMNVIFEQILKELQDTLSPEEVYEIFWSVRIGIITRNVITDGKKSEHDGNHNVSPAECVDTFAKEFASLLVKSIVNRQCFASFLDIIKNTLIINLREIFTQLNYMCNDIELGTNNALVIICLDILQYNIFETYMFAAILLPHDIHRCLDKEGYLKIIHKLRSCEFVEVKFYMYRKFVTLDYVFKDFMLPLRQGSTV